MNKIVALLGVFSVCLLISTVPSFGDEEEMRYFEQQSRQLEEQSRQQEQQQRQEMERQQRQQREYWRESDRMQREQQDQQQQEIIRQGYEQQQQQQQPQRPQYRPPPPPSGDPRLDAATGVLQGAVELQYQAAMRKAREITQTPFKERFPENGIWVFPHGKGECQAQFGSKRGMIMLYQSTTSQDASPATAKSQCIKGISPESCARSLKSGVTFIGFGMLGRVQLKAIRISFEQAGATPRTVQAAHGGFVSDLVGRLTVWDTPLVDKNFEQLPDKADFRISIDGKKTFTMGWRDGFKARDKLRQCLAGAVAARASK